MSLAARLGRAVFWGQAGRVAEALLFLLLYLFLARALGPAAYGVFALGMSFAAACAFLVLLGLGPETLGRFVPELAADGNTRNARRLLGPLLAVRGVAIVCACCLVFLFRESISARLHFSLAVAPLALVLLLFAARSVFDLLMYFSSGLLELRRVAAAKLASAGVAVTAFCVFWLCHKSNANAAWASLLFGLSAGVLILVAPFTATPQGESRATPSSAPLARILKFGLFAWATNIFIYILGDNTDLLLLGWLVRDRAAIGYYAIAAKIVFSLTGLLLGWVTLVSVTWFSEARRNGGIVRLASAAEAQWKVILLCLVAPLLFIVCHANEIITVLYSAAYLPGARALQILSGWMICAAAFGFSIQGGILYALDHEKIACLTMAAAAIFNLVTEIFLVRRLGICGAAWATGASFAVLAILCTLASSFYVPVLFPWQFLCRVIVAAGAGTASTLWIRPHSFLELTGAGTVCASVFFAALAFLKPLTESDSEGLLRMNARMGSWATRLFAAPASRAVSSR